MGEVHVRVRLTNAVGVTEPMAVEIDGHDTLDEALGLGLEKLNLLVDCDARRLIPNPRRPASRV